jgi:DNA-binding LacI/PurR family transcriptional regulator
VSEAAVSFALNGRAGVGEDTRRRILSVARDIGWTPSATARALSRSRSHALGLVLSRSPELLAADPFFPSFLAGVETALAVRGYALLLQVVGDERAERDSYRRLAQEGRVDGVFLTDMRVRDSRFTLLTELGLPALGIGRPIGPCPFPWTEVNDRAGIRQAVEHLIELGHTRIGHVCGTRGLVHSEHRRAAWQKATRRAGLSPVAMAVGDFTGLGGAKATSTLLALPEPPTAIIYANDLMAIAGASTAIDAALRLPEELSIVGHDDVPLAAHVTPALTTVRHDIFNWGETGARSLIALIEGQTPPTPKLDEPVLTVRGSTAAPMARKQRGRT